MPQVDLKNDMENNKQISEKPLDPAVERVRRKLMWFMIVSTTITFLLVFAVVVAVIYKVMQPTHIDKVQTTEISLSEAISAPTDNHFVLPAQSRLISQSISGDLISLHMALPDNSGVLIIYNYVSKQIVFKTILQNQ